MYKIFITRCYSLFNMLTIIFIIYVKHNITQNIY